MTARDRTFLKLVTLSVLLSSFAIPQTVLSQESTSHSKPLPIQRQVKPNPILVINRRTAKHTALLAAEDVRKIKTLQRAVTPIAISRISPDGTTVVVKWHESKAEQPIFRLLNIQAKSQVEVNSEQFQEFEPDYFYWRDARTAVALASKENEQGNQRYALLSIDRQNGTVTVEPLTLPGIPVSVAPDASRVLVQIEPAKREQTSPKQTFSERDEADETDPEDKPIEFRVITLPTLQELYRFALPAETALHASAWTPDGNHLALVRVWYTEKPSEFSWGGASLFSRLTRDVMGLLPPVENPYLQKNALISINLQTGDRQTLYASDSDGTAFSDVSWSPDGKTLLAQVYYPLKLKGRSNPIYFDGYSEHAAYRFYDANLHNRGHLELPELAHLDGDALANGQFASPNEVVFTALVGMDFLLFLYNCQSGQLRRLSDQVGSYGNVVVTPNSHQLVLSYSSFTNPPELYQMNLDGGTITPLTALNQEISQLSQTRADPVSFTLANGQTFDGTLIQPATADFLPHDVPMVVWQEGGPASSMVNSWGADVEYPFALLPNFGISVLVMPLYGRNGFGTERFDALYNDRNFGQIDIDAMSEIVQQAIAKGYTSQGKVGISGCSYGGYFTLQSIIRHPQLYAAANPQCSWVDMATDWSGDNSILPPFVYGKLTPYTDPIEFQQDSPIYNANQIQTPLLIFHGSEDRLPVSMMENIYWTVASAGIPARMVKFMGAGHGLVDSDKELSIPEYQLYAAQEMIQWFRTYLKPVQTTRKPMS